MTFFEYVRCTSYTAHSKHFRQPATTLPSGTTVGPCGVPESYDDQPSPNIASLLSMAFLHAVNTEPRHLPRETGCFIGTPRLRKHFPLDEIEVSLPLFGASRLSPYRGLPSFVLARFTSNRERITFCSSPSRSNLVTSIQMLL